MVKLCNSQDIFLAGKKSSDWDEPRGRGDKGGRRGGVIEDDTYRSFGGSRNKGKGRGFDRDDDERDFGRRGKGKGRDRDRVSSKGKGQGRQTNKGAGRSGGGGKAGGKKRVRDEKPEPTAAALDSALEEYFTGEKPAKKAKTEGGEKTKEGKTSKGLDEELDKYMGDSKEEFISKSKSHSEGILKEADEEKPEEKKEEEKKE